MINVYSQDNGELIFSYTKEMEPEVSEHGYYFSVYYEDGICDYSTSEYYYEEVAE